MLHKKKTSKKQLVENDFIIIIYFIFSGDRTLKLYIINYILRTEVKEKPWPMGV